MNRRRFLSAITAGPAAAVLAPPPALTTSKSPEIQTVLGPVPARDLGLTLVHEHVLVDFVGAAAVSRSRYRTDDVVRAVLPHLQEVKSRGVQTLLECTPAWLGRDPLLLRRLSEESGVRLVTNTGYYGAADDKFVPAHAYAETADELAARWTAEAREGIEGTGLRPGFLKSGVDRGPLSVIDRKLIVAAARCHRATGLTIAVHTGDGTAAFDILGTLKAEGVGASAYVWVHAQNEKDRSLHMRAADAGCFVEFDGISPEGLDAQVLAVTDLARRGHLGRLLVSQDAGWYNVGEPGGGRFRGYTLLLDEFVPALRKSGITEAQVRTLLVDNPARAFAPSVRLV
ncbi:MAG TPA: twin-arginine translocation signal domain-containing protein [Vicinamibacteria bacterium]|nr:twin-arginine translocation signal domain-containing protein [Vicinamibacteria bacterium]